MIKKVLIYIFLILGFLLFSLPFVYMVIASTQDNEMITSIPPSLIPGDDTVYNIEKLSSTYNYFNAFKNTVIVTVVGTLLGITITTMAGYAFAKFQFKGKNFYFKLLIFTSTVPIFSTVVPLFIIFSQLGILNSYASLIIPGLAAASTIFLMRQYMYSVPDEILESARIDGASEASIFWKIVTPISIPAIVTGGLTIFVGYWNSYLWPLISVRDEHYAILPLVIRNMGLVQDEVYYGVRYMGLTLSIIPVIILYVLIQSRFKNTGVGSAIK